MLSLMSIFYEQENLDIFFKKYNKQKTKIFDEIYSYLGSEDFKSKKDFQNKYKEILSHETNKRKVLSSGLILKIYEDDSKLHLTDQNSTFEITIDFLKRVEIENKENNKKSKSYIISKTYYSYYFNILKKRKIKFKLEENRSELSLSSDNLEEIIFNSNLKYLSSYPDYNQIYEKIFQILENEKDLETISPAEFFNDFRTLSFPEIKKPFLNKIKWKATNFDDYCWGYKYLYYNKKIGLSVALQKHAVHLFKKKKKVFYCDVDFLINETDIKKIRNYLFFNLYFLFSTEEQDSYKNFIENDIVNLINQFNGGELVKSILEIIHKKFKEFKLYIDNIKTESEFIIIKNFMDSKTLKDVLIFVQINISTIYTISKVFKYNLIENRELGPSFIDDLEFYIPISVNITDEKELEDLYSDKLKTFFEKYDYQNYLKLLNIKNIINTKDSYYLNLATLGPFFEFLYVKPRKFTIKEIYFRNNFIKDKFNDNYNRYITKFKNIDKNIFYNITKLEEGINFEAQIIYDLILNININKIKVDKIFSIQKFPEINFNFNNSKEYLFTQENTNSPYYDIAYLYYNEGFNVLKGCQIGINKDLDDLKKLNINFLLFDLYYFCQKIKYQKGIKINKIELCIITTKNAYDEQIDFLEKKIKSKDRKYPNFNVMKKFCEENGFIFLIFDTKDSQFYRCNNNFELEKTDLKYSNSKFEVKEIFLKDEYISETEKLNYFFNPKKSNKIGEINLPSNFPIENLNKEFIFEINENTAYYYQEDELENLFKDEEHIKYIQFEEKIKRKYNESSESESLDKDYDDGEYKNSEIDYDDDEDDYKEKSEKNLSFYIEDSKEDKIVGKKTKRKIKKNRNEPKRNKLAKKKKQY